MEEEDKTGDITTGKRHESKAPGCHSPCSFSQSERHNSSSARKTLRVAPCFPHNLIAWQRRERLVESKQSLQKINNFKKKNNNHGVRSPMTRDINCNQMKQITVILTAEIGLKSSCIPPFIMVPHGGQIEIL